MWVVAGVLIGIVILSSLAGFHAGPHAHFVAGAVGVLAAAWFVVMMADGRSGPVLWALLSADLVVASGVGMTAWKGIKSLSIAGHHLAPLESAEGVALSDLAPVGVVRVRGEDWSAASVNGTVRMGEKVQVIRADGVRLEVWGEDAEQPSIEGIFDIEAIELEELGA